jgi:hypothetical protein
VSPSVPAPVCVHASRDVRSWPSSYLEQTRLELLQPAQFTAALGGLRAAAGNEKFSAVRVAAMDAVVKWLQRPEGTPGAPSFTMRWILSCARAGTAAGYMARPEHGASPPREVLADIARQLRGDTDSAVLRSVDTVERLLK